MVASSIQGSVTRRECLACMTPMSEPEATTVPLEKPGAQGVYSETLSLNSGARLCRG